MREQDEARIAFLKSRLTQAYKLKEAELMLEDIPFHIGYIANIDDLLEELIAKEPDDPALVDEQIPYWAELWHASIGLAIEVLKDRNKLKGVKVLEIGCGMGLPGIAAAKVGAEVRLSDYLPEALTLAEYIALRNGLSDLSYLTLDWRNMDEEPIPDVLLASDVAYENRAWEPLMKVFRQVISNGGEVWLSEPGRTMTRTWLTELKQNFELSQIDRLVSLGGLDSEVGIYKMNQIR